MSVQVAVRCRPFNQREIGLGSKLIVDMGGNQTFITDPESGEKKTFTYDYSFWSHDGFGVDENVEF